MSAAEPVPRAALDSLTLRSVAAIAVAAAAERLGLTLPAGAAQDLAGALVDLIVTLGLIGVAIGRSRARGPIV
jgi:cadmium resistance protein CadD (predicted permease)